MGNSIEQRVKRAVYFADVVEQSGGVRSRGSELINRASGNTRSFFSDGNYTCSRVFAPFSGMYNCIQSAGDVGEEGKELHGLSIMLDRIYAIDRFFLLV